MNAPSTIEAPRPAAAAGPAVDVGHDEPGAVLVGLEVLSQAERVRAGSYRDDDARDTWIRSRAWVRAALARRLGVDPADVPLAVAPTGRPVLRGGPPVSFSRTPGAVVLAVGEAGPVGVDVERVRRVGRGSRIAARGLSRDDETTVLGLPPGRERDRAIVRGWVALEAVVKAWGVGLSAMSAYRRGAGPRRADGTAVVRDPRGRRWVVAPVAVSPDHEAAVAWAAGGGAA